MQASLRYSLQDSDRLAQHISDSGGAATAVSGAVDADVQPVVVQREETCCKCSCEDKIPDCSDSWVPALWAGDGICDDGDEGTDANFQCDRFFNDLGDCDASSWEQCASTREERCGSLVALEGYAGTVGDLLGCTDVSAPTYAENARFNDGTCEDWTVLVVGCMDSDAFNYDPLANVESGNCIPRVYGCNDAEAFNFVEEANTNDGVRPKSAGAE